MKILKFYVGRGGRFNNAGHISYVGEERIDEGSAFNDLMYDEENDEYLDSAGNPLHDDLTKEDLESGIGTINIDHGYDTTYTKYPNNLNQNERMAILKDNPYNCGELLVEDQDMLKILLRFNKLYDYVSNEYNSLEDVGIHVADDTECLDVGCDEINGVCYKLEE